MDTNKKRKTTKDERRLTQIVFLRQPLPCLYLRTSGVNLRLTSLHFYSCSFAVEYSVV